MAALDGFGLAVVALTLVLQLVAAVYAFLLIRLTGRNLAWLLMASALTVSAVGRAVVFVSNVLVDPITHLTEPTRFISLLISVLFLAAVLAIRPVFVRMQQTQCELRRTTRLLRARTEASQALLGAETEAELAAAVCRSTVEVGGYRLAWVGFAEDNEQRTVRKVAAVGSARADLEGLAVGWGDDALGAGPVGTAIRTGKAVVLRDVPSDPALAPWREQALDHGIFSALGIPLREEDRVIGALGIYAQSPDAFQAEERGLLEELAGDLAYGLRHLRLQRQREEAEAAVRRSEERLRVLFEHATEAAFILDDTGKIAFVSPQAMPVLGFPPEELLGRIGFDLIHPEDLPRAQLAFGELFVSPGTTTRFEGRVALSDGSWGVVEMVGSNLLADPHVQGIVVNCRNVTGRRRMETALKESEERLRLSQRLEAVGQLAGGIAHDFNNTLTVIGGYAEFLAGGLPESDPGRDDLAEIRRACGRAATMIRQLLAFSRRQLLEPRILDLNRTIMELEPLLRRLIDTNIELQISCGPELHPVLADPGQLEQVVMNLVVNSRDAMPQGGKLLIETANVELDQEYVARHIATTPGAHVLLAVTDTGVGMDAGIQARAFDPFFTTKASGQGTGLGLSTVYGIVKQSGGNVWIYSEPEQGATFKIYLPGVAGAAPEEPERPSPPATRDLRGTETVLVVEDDEMLRFMAGRALRTHGYAVLEAESGVRALEIVEEHEGAIDCLVTDVVMPTMGGLELALQAGDRKPGLKVLYMTGYTRGAVAEKALIPPDAWLLEKPFSPVDLVSKVREVLRA